MLSDFKYLERKYKHLFPDYELLQIEEIALPVAKVKIQVLGQVVTETTPITEFLLRFIHLGVDNPADLAETLGLSLDLVLDEIAEEIRQGRVKRGLSDKLILTSLGQDVRTSAAIRMPKKLSIEFIFDKGTFKLKNWEKHLFISSADLKEISKNILKSFEHGYCAYRQCLTHSTQAICYHLLIFKMISKASLSDKTGTPSSCAFRILDIPGAVFA